jgi:Spy/CpxP family protein refolding chaperone
MKLKLMPVLTGAIALASLAATPLIVKALPAAPGQPLLAQSLGQKQLGQGGMGGMGGMRRGGGGGMNLTEDQRAQIKKIREQTQKDIRAVLTKEQRAQYDAAMQESRQNLQSAMQNRSGGANGGLRGGAMNGGGMNGGGMRNRQAGGGQMGGQQAILNSLNLSEDQQQEIQEIMKRQREQMQALLTDSQRQQLQQRSSQFGTQNQ